MENFLQEFCDLVKTTLIRAWRILEKMLVIDLANFWKSFSLALIVLKHKHKEIYGRTGRRECVPFFLYKNICKYTAIQKYKNRGI